MLSSQAGTARRIGCAAHALFQISPVSAFSAKLLSALHPKNHNCQAPGTRGSCCVAVHVCADFQLCSPPPAGLGVPRWFVAATFDGVPARWALTPSSRCSHSLCVGCWYIPYQAHDNYRMFVLNPFKTAVPFWGQTT